MLNLEYHCADGTPFPVRFDCDDDAAIVWRLEQEHARRPVTPMADALERLAVPGAERAYAEAGMPMPPMWRPGPWANGYMYFSEQPIPPDDFGRMVEAAKALVAEYGSSEDIWRRFCLPRSEAAAAELDSAGPEVPWAELAQTQAYGQQMTMVAAIVCGNDLELLTAACREVCGDDAPLVAYELTQGYPNETLRADHELWQLARLVAASPRLQAAVDSADPAGAVAQLRAAGEEPDFAAALDRFLAEFGRRAEDWDIASPTYAEQGPGFWGQLRALSDPDVPDPALAIEAGAHRREALTAELAARFDDDDKRARFLRRVARAATYVDVREHRAYWQVVLVGALRGAVLRRGAALVDGGVLDRADDILYLRPDEVDAVDAAAAGKAAAELRALVAQRRAEQAEWADRVPPQVIGGSDPAAAGNGAVGTGDQLKGVGASRGTATGPARVVTDLADADRVEPGDVLVCVMTSPPWTPLFAIAAAVVTETGALGSHPAIAAREYGIPCVVGVSGATRAIPDGATITVDGAAGTVGLSA